MKIQIGDIVKFDYGIAYYGIVIECKGGMVCVKWFDEEIHHSWDEPLHYIKHHLIKVAQ